MNNINNNINIVDNEQKILGKESNTESDKELENSEKDQIQETQDQNLLLLKKRRPCVAAFLTFLVIGLGHVYNGEFQEGLFYYLGSLVISLATAFLMLILPFPANFVIFFTVGIIYFIYVMVKSWKSAKNKKEIYYLKSYNKLTIYLSLIFCSWYIVNPIFSQVIRNNVVHPYRVIANSMVPTIFDGDYILVNELIYEVSSPHRGDIAVFKYPRNETQYFIKRIIGLPGDIILIREKKCYINGELLKEKYTIHTNRMEIGYPELENFGPVKLPPDFFFVMGDNRDWSMDSRSFGPVHRGKFLGKAFMIYWSGSIDEEIKWDRIGKNIK